MMHGWQSDSTDGRTERWLELHFLKWLPWSTHPQLPNVVWCGVVSNVFVSRSCSCTVIVVQLQLEL